MNEVSRDYFATMGMHMLAGRDFVRGDALDPKHPAPTKTVVNEAFLRRFFPVSNAIGRRFGTGTEGEVASAANEIIGVVSDAKYRSLRDPIRPMCYSLETNLDSEFMLSVRTRSAPETIIQPVGRALASAAPGLALLETGTLAEAVESTTAPQRMTATLASLFGAMATLIAGIGIYGLLVYSVTQRRREIGIRMALGAQPAHVTKLIAQQTAAMTVLGILAGVGAALLMGSLTRSLLYEISPQDPTLLAAAALVVAIIATAATAVPVLDAVRTRPSETLRIEA